MPQNWRDKVMKTRTNGTDESLWPEQRTHERIIQTTHHGGFSVLDSIASSAMNGLLANPAIWRESGGEDRTKLPELAELAYDIAKAMYAERLLRQDKADKKELDEVAEPTPVETEPTDPPAKSPFGTTNVQMVALLEGDIVIMAPKSRMNKAEAILHAAWIVALADPDEEEFEPVLSAVINT